MSLSLNLGLSLRGGGGAAAPFTPASLGLTGWWPGGYAGSPYPGTATAGTSGAQSLSSASAPTTPAIVTLDGFGAPSTDGVGTYLRDVTPTATFLSSSAFTIAMLVNFTGVAAASAASTPYLDQQLICELSDLLGISATTTGVAAWFYDGVVFTRTALVACPAGSYAFVVATLGGGVLSTSVNDGAAATLAKGNVNNLSQALNIGRSRSAGSPVWCAETIPLLAMSNTKLSALSITDLYTWTKARFPSAGLP